MEGDEAQLDEEAVGVVGTRSLLLLAVLSIFAVVAWSLIEGSERRAFLRQHALTSQQAALRLEEHVGARLRATRALAAEIAVSPPRDGRDFEGRARAMMEAFGGIASLRFADATGTVRAGVDGSGPVARGEALVGDAASRARIDAVLAEGGERFSPAAPGADGALEVRFHRAVLDPATGRVDGVVSAGLALRALVEAGLAEQKLVLRDGPTEIYRSPGLADAPIVEEATLQLAGREWSLGLAPSGQLVDHLKSHRHDVALFFALGLIVIMIFLMRARALDRRRGAQLARDRARLATLVETSPELQALTDREGRILYVNRAGRAWLGGDLAPSLPSRFADDEQERVQLGLGEALAGELFRADLHLRGPEGLRPGVVQARALAGVDCVAWVIRDRSEERRLEQELEQAQKLEALGRLAGGVAHDFNNLLTALLGHATLARDEVDAESPARADLEAVVAGARRGAELTRNLLAFSRQRVTETRVLDVSDELRRSERTLRYLVRENVRFEPQLLAAQAWVRMAPSQLEQMVMNLVVNAVDAMPEGGTLRVALDVGDGDVRVLVEDDGLGMTEQVRARAFEPFFTTKREAGGTGLGLASVYGTVRQLGGDVTLKSAPGEGTQVTLRLPQSTKAPEVIDVAKTARGIPPMRVLLVEDEDGVRRTAARLLRREGHEVTQAVDGLEARERWIEEGPFELVMTDVVMPRLGGIDLVKQLRARGMEAPVILCSGYADELRDTETVDDLGARFLEKPYDLGTLREALQEASELRKARASEAPAPAVAGGAAV
ncbi:MAG: ATP-binding protein [Myxococcota bacterium]